MRSIIACIVLLLAAQMGMSQPALQRHSGAKAISPDLFGIFFEDISYAADGGLYAELVQNRSFEYGPADQKGWHPLTAWDYMTEGFGYGSLTVEAGEPLHPHNPHYIVLTVEEPGQEGIGEPGPVKVPAGELGKLLGTRQLSLVRGKHELAMIDTPLEHA